MERQWCASFAPVRAGSDIKSKLTSLHHGAFIVGVLLWAGLGLGTASASPGSSLPGSSQEAPSIDLDFMKLPAFRVEWMKEGESSKVGDVLKFKIVGLGDLRDGPKNVSKELKLDVSNSEKILREQGWEIDPKEGGSESLTELLFLGIPIKPGNISLPSLPIKDLKGKTVARTEPFSLEVSSAIRSNDPKPDEPENLAPPVGLQFPWWIVVLWTLLGVIVLGSGIYGLIRWKKGKKGPVLVVPEIVLPEDQVALQALGELEKLGLLQKGNFKAHYFKLSEILKTYIGARYGFDALESTTRELILILEQKNLIGNSSIDALEGMFGKLDRVKFTDHVPSLEESSLLIQDVKRFVSTTRRVPPILANETGLVSDAPA